MTILKLSPSTNDEDAKALLKRAAESKWLDLVIVGYADTGEFSYAHSPMTKAEVNLLIDKLKMEMLDMYDDDSRD